MMAVLGAEAHAGTAILRDGVLSIDTDGVGGDRMEYVFERCMANKLFTFARVTLNGKVVNSATSDNIGPFLLEGRGWTGGNHLLDNGKPSAETMSVSIAMGGRMMVDGDSLEMTAPIVVDVTNRLVDPAQPDSTFAIERVRYVVAGNSIDVTASHKFENASPMKIDRYYGMQSMMNGETEIKTPAGTWGEWAPVSSINRFAKSSAPHFTTFLERMPEACQVTCMLPEGLGTRTMVDDDDVVFIGNSWTKSYHKIIGNRTVSNGDTTTWHGVYSWLSDAPSTVPGQSAWVGTLNGVPTLFFADSTGLETYTITH